MREEDESAAYEAMPRKPEYVQGFLAGIEFAEYRMGASLNKAHRTGGSASVMRFVRKWYENLGYVLDEHKK